MNCLRLTNHILGAAFSGAKENLQEECMKLKYLGTAAAEGIPGVFCTCPVCTHARENKGKNIRTRSQALLDGKILFDFPADTYMRDIASGFTAVDLPAIRHVFITHSHSDHFYPAELELRRSVFVLQEPIEILNVYGNKAVMDAFRSNNMDEWSKGYNVYHFMEAFKPVEADGYKITPLTAKHSDNEDCLFYMAEHDGKALLYAHDTGFFPETVWEHFGKTKIRFDLVSLDCTSMTGRDGGYHMGILDCAEMRKRLFSIGAADEKTVFVLNHFSHGGGLNHEELCAAAAKENFLVSWDGFEVIAP